MYPDQSGMPQEPHIDPWLTCVLHLFEVVVPSVFVREISSILIESAGESHLLSQHRCHDIDYFITEFFSKNFNTMNSHAQHTLPHSQLRSDLLHTLSIISIEMFRE